MSFANLYSTSLVPNKVNTNTFIPLQAIDNTTDFAINNLDSTKLVAKSAGAWQFVIQIQLVGLTSNNNPKASLLDGYLAINGKPISGSDATQSTMLDNETSVLTIAGIGDLSVGDYIQFGIRTSNTLNINGQSGVSSKGFMGFGTDSNNNPVYAPSTILTITRLNSSCVQTGSYISYTNGNHRVVFDNTSLMTQIGNDLEIDENGNLKVNTDGIYYLCAQFQLLALNYVNTNLAIETTEVDGFFSVTRDSQTLLVGGSMASNNAVQTGSTNVLPISITIRLKTGDIVNVNANVGSNVSVSGFMSNTGVYAPSVIFTAITAGTDARYLSIGSRINYSQVNTTQYVDFSNEYKIYNPHEDENTYNNGFSVSGSTITAINAGNFMFACQYQLFGNRSLNPIETGDQSQLDGWVETSTDGITWSQIISSDAAASLRYKGQWLVLFISVALHLEPGQSIRFAVNSNNSNNDPVSVLQQADGTPNIIPDAPSVILTAFEIIN